jgi:hypothetical protein
MTMVNVPTPYAPKGNESIHDALMRFALELHGVNPPDHSRNAGIQGVLQTGVSPRACRKTSLFFATIAKYNMPKIRQF